MMELGPDFKEFFESLNNNNVRYLVVGGYAVAFHGHPRYTKDIDIWIEATPENAGNLINSLHDFGCTRWDWKRKIFFKPAIRSNSVCRPTASTCSRAPLGLEFDECFRSKVDVNIAGLTVHFIDLDHLKQNKRAVGRLQDLADLENLT